MDDGQRSHFRRLSALSSVSRGRSNEQRRQRHGSAMPTPLPEPLRIVADARGCRWPEWLDGETPPHPAPFCCAPVSAGKAFCRAHSAVAYLPKDK